MPDITDWDAGRVVSVCGGCVCDGCVDECECVCVCVCEVCVCEVCV